MLKIKLKILACLFWLSDLGKVIKCKTLLTHFTKKSIKANTTKGNLIQEMNWLAFTVITRDYYQITNHITSRMVMFFYSL